MPHTRFPARTRNAKTARRKRVRTPITQKLKIEDLIIDLKQQRQKYLDELDAIDRMGNLFF